MPRLNLRSAGVLLLAAGGLAWAAISLRAEGSGLIGLVLRAVWAVPGLVALHLFQLWLSSIAWRGLERHPKLSVGTMYRLRIIREGIDSLLPVAQVGGEVIGARLMGSRGVPLGEAAATVVVDVTVELLTQLVFLLAGVVVLAILAHALGWSAWARLVPVLGAFAIGAIAAQRFGLLHALEVLSEGVARRWPAIGGASLAGLNAATLRIYRQRKPMLQAAGLHMVAWTLGTLETWGLLYALGTPVGWWHALVIESLGMAGRSAGFAIPAALGAQEGGFVLAAATVGVPLVPALALSLVKRLREIVVGLIGMALWRSAARAAIAS